MAKPLDLTGKRFGSLVVDGRAPNNHRGNTQWYCTCDCGGKKIVLGYDLTKGRTTTCGCKSYLKGKPSHARVDLVGKRYGKLVVTSLNESLSKDGVLVWNCLCDCGNTFTARGGNLKCGKAWHCGCSTPPRNYVDLTGERYGRLMVIGVARHDADGIYWNCLCDCGGTKVVKGEDLRSGHVRSCGCLLKESRRRNALTRSLENRNLQTDANTYRRIRAVFNGMHRRCTNGKPGSRHYYDRGIRVCDEWTEFEPFLEWSLSHGYEKGLSIDRIDVNGNYCPENCRWVTQKVQQNNKRDNVYLVIDGEKKTLRQWCDHYGINYRMVLARRRRGWPESRWFDEPHSNQYR